MQSRERHTGNSNAIANECIQTDRRHSLRTECDCCQVSARTKTATEHSRNSRMFANIYVYHFMAKSNQCPPTVSMHMSTPPVANLCTSFGIFSSVYSTVARMPAQVELYCVHNMPTHLSGNIAFGIRIGRNDHFAFVDILGQIDARHASTAL